MSVGGTVNISRRLWDDEAFAKEPFSEREAWIWMIAEASWKARKHRVGDYIVALERGQLAGSIRFFAKAWEWAPAKVQRYFVRLQRMELISAATDTGVTVITICKYNEYQNAPKATDTGVSTGAIHKPIHQATHDAVAASDGIKREKRSGGQAADTPTDTGVSTNENTENKGLKKETAKAVSKERRGTRLPDDWTLPDEWKDWALSQQWPEAAVRLEADKFADFWRSKSGKDATKLDWQATWRNWMRNSKAPRLIDGRGPPAVGYATQAMELLRQRREQQ